MCVCYPCHSVYHSVVRSLLHVELLQIIGTDPEPTGRRSSEDIEEEEEERKVRTAPPHG